MSVVTLAEAKTHLDIATGTTTYDTEIQAFLNRAEGLIGKRVGPLEPTAKSERRPGYCTTLYLSHTPIVSVTSVTGIEGTTVDVNQLTTLSGGRLTFKQGGWFASRFYDVVYSAGYATLPDDLKEAVLEMVRDMWSTQLGGGAATIGTFPSDALSNTLSESAHTLPTNVERLIALYVPVLGA